MRYNPPTGSTDPNASYVGANTAAGTQGSKVPRLAIEGPQRELAAVIGGAGLTPTNDDMTQLLQAIGLLSAAKAAAVINQLRIPGGTPKQFAAPGSYTLNIAINTTFSVTECRAGGGGGGGANATGAAGSGGGGGSVSTKVATALTAVVLAITVGQGGTGGAGGASPGTGGAGGTTSVAVQSGTVIDTNGTQYTAGQTLCAAAGGGGGSPGNGGLQGSLAGAGGVASGGDLNIPGDSGGYPFATGSTNIGGLGGASPGSGSFPQPNSNAVGNTSNASGVGGNGSSTNGLGGAGTAGRVTIYR